jgi:hypothetical protein
VTRCRNGPAMEVVGMSLQSRLTQPMTRMMMAAGKISHRKRFNHTTRIGMLCCAVQKSAVYSRRLYEDIHLPLNKSPNWLDSLAVSASSIYVTTLK